MTVNMFRQTVSVDMIVCVCTEYPVPAQFSPCVSCEVIFGSAFHLSGRLIPGYLHPRLGALWVLFIHWPADGSLDG